MEKPEVWSPVTKILPVTSLTPAFVSSPSSLFLISLRTTEVDRLAANNTKACCAIYSNTNSPEERSVFKVKIVSSTRSGWATGSPCVLKLRLIATFRLSAWTVSPSTPINAALVTLDWSAIHCLWLLLTSVIRAKAMSAPVRSKPSALEVLPFKPTNADTLDVPRVNKSTSTSCPSESVTVDVVFSIAKPPVTEKKLATLTCRLAARTEIKSSVVP